MKMSLIIAGISLAILAGCSPARKAGKRNNGNGTQTENNSDAIVNKYWKLITLDGKKVSMAKNQEREAYFILKTKGNSVAGFAGCNTFSGTYTLTNDLRIRFSQMAATLKACPDVDVNESEFLQVFELTDNYTISGDTLSLNVGRRAPLAVFEAVYFH